MNFHYELQEQRARLLIDGMSDTEKKALLYRLKSKRDKTEFEGYVIDELVNQIGEFL
jgi:hypothetical protein